MPRLRRLLLLTAAAAMWLGAVDACANNISVTNVSIVPGPYTTVQFDISWENSWRCGTGVGPNNYDAAWVFIKYSTDSGTTWNHATLKATTNTPMNDSLGYSIGSGTALEIKVPVNSPAQSGDKKGAFLQRSAAGQGTVRTTEVKLMWDWSADGLSGSNTAIVKVFALEMVYVPQGTFYLGDGNSSTEAANAFHLSSADNTKVLIGATSQSVSADPNQYDDIDTIPVTVNSGSGGIAGNASWPTGYSAYYITKYEITQGGYRDFLNTLTRAQQNNRTYSQSAGALTLWNSPGGSPNDKVGRNGISNPASIPAGAITFGCDLEGSSTDDGSLTWVGNRDGVFNEENDGETCALSFVSWPDLCAYFDWAALRPITEFEYEKACRGTDVPAPNDCATGSHYNSIVKIPAATFCNQGKATEAAPGANANTTCDANIAVYGPVRVGFSATPYTNRLQSGGSFYGVMDLTGNMGEAMVFFGNAGGRAFDGSHGDGTLTTTTGYEGNATNTGWPGINATTSRGVTSGSDTSGASNRISSWANTAGQNSVSARPAPTGGDLTTRWWSYGGHGAHSAQW